MTKHVEKEWEFQGLPVDWRRSSSQIGAFTKLAAERVGATYSDFRYSMAQIATVESVIWQLGDPTDKRFSKFPQTVEFQVASHLVDDTPSSSIAQLTTESFFHQFGNSLEGYFRRTFHVPNYGGYTQFMWDLEERTRHDLLRMELVQGKNGFEVVQMVTRDYWTQR